MLDWHKYLIRSLALSITLTCLALADTPSRRPKIGLVLAGGGAKGIAHVGVLKVLEQNRIPIDFVAGTSMGSIVGAAYAAGLSIEEIESEFLKVNWDELFDENIPRSDLDYRLKSGREGRIVGDAKFAIAKGKTIAPIAFVQGQKLLPLFQRLFSRTEVPISFDSLPVPFRCVAADIETGEEVVIKYGDLATSTRASMAVPGLFAPVEIDDRVLVDGGIVNNMPVNLAQEAGCDIVIAVELPELPKKREELQSLPAISGQVLTFMLAENVVRSKKLLRPQDILISPDLKGMGAGDFKKASELLACGVEGANNALDRLKNLSIPEYEYVQYKDNRIKKSSDTFVVEFININNESSFPTERIREEVELKEGEQFDRTAIENAVNRLYGKGIFSKVSYDTPLIDGKKGVEISVVEKNWYKQSLQFGLSLEQDITHESNFALASLFRFAELNSLGAEAEIYGQLGANPGIFTEFYQPFGETNPFFIAPAAGYQRKEIDLMLDNDVVAEYWKRTAYGQLRLGSELGSLGEIYVKALRGSGDFKRNVGLPTLDESSFDSAELSPTLVIDTLDNPDFPHKGVRLWTSYVKSYEDLGASESYSQNKGGFSLPIELTSNDTFVLRGDFGLTEDAKMSYHNFSLGGFFDLSGYPQNSLYPEDYGIIRAMIFRRLSKIGSSLLGLDLYGGLTAEYAYVKTGYEKLDDNTNISAGSVFLGADTPLAPFYIGLGFSEEGERALYFTLGRLNIGNRGM